MSKLGPGSDLLYMWLCVGTSLACACGARSAIDQPAQREVVAGDSGAEPDARRPDEDVQVVVVSPEDNFSVRYCECMRNFCFTFHPGTLELAECVALADRVPRRGAPVREGNFIECRHHYCLVHIGSLDGDDCRRAGGEFQCVD